MFSTFKSFSTELKFYLLMNIFFSFGFALSGVFQNVFLWKLDKTYSLLANYSLYNSITVIISFVLCSWIARKTSPMFTMRLGLICYLISFLIMLLFHDTLKEHIILLGTVSGLAMGLYYVGVHIAVLDLTSNDKRDKFLYIQGILLTFGGAIGPLIAGLLISQFKGMTGYYVVFIATCVFFFLAFLVSLKVKGKPIESKSYFWDVIRKPSREWKKMYPVMFCDGIVSGVYLTFLITMMTYKVAGGELNLGIFNTAAEIVSIVAFFLLARFSSPHYRVAIFAIGSIGIFFGSVLISVLPLLISLILFAIIQPVAMNMISTSMNAMIYESIERDQGFKEKRLDYIIIREIPLGFGRIVGVFMFLVMKKFFDMEQLLPVSFSIFPFVFVIMIPSLYFVWRKPKGEKKLSLTV